MTVWNSCTTNMVKSLVKVQVFKSREMHHHVQTNTQVNHACSPEELRGGKQYRQKITIIHNMGTPRKVPPDFGKPPYVLSAPHTWGYQNGTLPLGTPEPYISPYNPHIIPITP